MRLPIASRSATAPVNMTPMIDVVFQLIVFFTATSTMVKTEFNLTVDLPAAEKGKNQDEASAKKKITANVLSGGDVLVGGRRVGAAEFQEILAAELAQRPADQLEVQFRGDRAAPYGSVEPLLLVCARKGVWQVSFAVKRANQK
jgi:biopolymer transport protein ExbD